MGGGGMGGLKMGGGLGGALGGPKKLIKKPGDKDVADAKKSVVKEDNKEDAKTGGVGTEENASQENTGDDEEKKEEKKDGKQSKAKTKASQKTDKSNLSKVTPMKSKGTASPDASIGDNVDTPKKKAPTEKKEKKDAPPPKPGMGGSGGGGAPGKKNVPEPKVPFTQEEAETHIAEHMERHNRPYAV